MIFFLEKKLIYSSARLYYIARFTEATVTDPYQTSREWGLTLKNCLSKVQNYTIEKNRGGGGFLGPLEAQRAFSASWSSRRVPRFI